MWRQTKRIDLSSASLRWGGAACLALVLTAVSLGVFILTWPGAPDDFRSELFFWGSILRPQELVPGEAVGDEDERNVRIVAPSAVFAPLQSRAWGLGAAVEKPELLKVSAEEGEPPPKFSAEKVEPGASGTGDGNVDFWGIPDAPRVFLRRQGK